MSGEQKLLEFSDNNCGVSRRRPSGYIAQERREVTIHKQKLYQIRAKRRWSLLCLVSLFIGALSRCGCAIKRGLHLLLMFSQANEELATFQHNEYQIRAERSTLLYLVSRFVGGCCCAINRDCQLVKYSEDNGEYVLVGRNDCGIRAERRWDWSVLYLVSRFACALSRPRHARNRDRQLLISSQENNRRKALNSWRRISLFFQFLYKIRKCLEETKRNRITVSSSRHLVIKNWQRGIKLGSGSFSTVYEAITDEGWLFAVKEVSLLGQDCQNISHAKQEISLLRQFKHENIVSYLGSDKDDSKFCIFLELVSEGSLAKLYRKYPLKDSHVSLYTSQILRGLNYLHSQGVIHRLDNLHDIGQQGRKRDIKCANILVDKNGSVKLADFGLAKVTKLNDIKSCKGTPFWMAPEVVKRNNDGYGTAADIWSLGCTVLEMLTRQNPYHNLEIGQALFKIGRGEGPPVPTDLSKDAQDFIHKCLQVEPKDRPTAAQLLEHSFVGKHRSDTI